MRPAPAVHLLSLFSLLRLGIISWLTHVLFTHTTGGGGGAPRSGHGRRRPHHARLGPDQGLAVAGQQGAAPQGDDGGGRCVVSCRACWLACVWFGP